ncbi:MAG: hypothetical protein QNJ77_03975 [Acidimicrobiia bacterium]|nr:hypothetical protein [Acidimicrobiia bacterium]
MRKKIIATLTSAGLVAGAGISAVVVSSPGLAVAQEEGVEAPAAPGSDHRRGRVFADLVESGVLDEDEVVAIHEVLAELRESMKEENGDTARPQRRHPVRAGYRLHELLEDGVIDADEIAALPEDSPILDPDGPFAAYLADGELSQDELEELRTVREAEEEERRAAVTEAVTAALQTLVDDGTLDSDQLDAVLTALETARDQRAHPVRRGMRAGWQIAEMLEDGVIDAAELAELPDGHPLADPDGPAAEYLDDGQLTRDELEELRGQHAPPSGSVDIAI